MSQEAASLVTDLQNDPLLDVYGFVTVVTVAPMGHNPVVPDEEFIFLSYILKISLIS